MRIFGATIPITVSENRAQILSYDWTISLSIWKCLLFMEGSEKGFYAESTEGGGGIPKFGTESHIIAFFLLFEPFSF